MKNKYEGFSNVLCAAAGLGVNIIQSDFTYRSSIQFMETTALHQAKI